MCSFFYSITPFTLKIKVLYNVSAKELSGESNKRKSSISLWAERWFSSGNVKNHKALPLSPIKEYLNPDLQKKIIFSDNQDRSGVYCWVNKVNGKFYIGSSSNLNTRFRHYYSLPLLKSNYSMVICRALMKYGFSNFELYIFEYCDKKDILNREQYYFDLLKPTYNILTVAGSSLGVKRTEETKLKISKALSLLPNGVNHPMFGKVLSEEIRAKMRIAKLGENHFGYGKPLTGAHKAKIAASQQNIQKVSVLDLETKTEIIYSSMRDAARALNCLVGSISYSLKCGKKPLKGRYVIRKV